MHNNILLWETKFTNISDLKRDWNFETLPARKYNNELQSYNEDAIKIENEELIITMLKHKHNITSGRLNSRSKVEVKYGYIEGMLKFSSGKGLWPAFWLLGNQLTWPNCGEIDIMEWVGWNINAVYGSLHGPGFNGGNCYGSGPKHVLGHPLSEEYHKYAIEWKPQTIKWFIDDQLFFTATKNDVHRLKRDSYYPFDDRPFYFVLKFCGWWKFWRCISRQCIIHL